MSKERATSEQPAEREVRPVDLGLSEGKSMAFAPAAVLQPEGPPIGGLAPASPNPADASGAGSSDASAGQGSSDADASSGD